MMISDDKGVILIVENNIGLGAFVSEILWENFNIVKASDGNQGQLLARKINPDLILCDVTSPLINGYDLCRILKSDFNTSRLPIILLSNEASVASEIEGLRAGADDYLVLPCDNQLFELRIKKLMRIKSTLSDQEMVISSQPKLSEVTGGFLEKLTGIVQENLSDPDFGVHQMAFHIGISVSVLYRKLRLLTGGTVNDFVKDIRMKRALQLLEVGTYHVNEVANAVGYEDSKYFSREFRKTYGKVPKEIKRGSPK
ncbi:response regulator transcription factor [Dyadobacter luteus]|nr:helix-turn-helix domain-containing protein [Dyadobacter luteus]